jgi:hypothetical protein
MFAVINEGRTQTPFVENFRSSFATSFVNNCVRSFGVKETTRPKAVAQQVCQCTADGVLDRISGNEVKAASDPAVMKPIIEAEGSRCVEAAKKELSKAPRSN